MDEEIQKIGIKAYSLKLLKEKRIFEENLYISSYMPSKEEFVKELESEGFKDGDELSCRTSHPSKEVHLPRTIVNSFDEAYEFYANNLRKGFSIVLHTLMHAKYAGTITKADNELVFEFVEGDWNADYSLNMDTAIFNNVGSTWYLYQGKRKVPYVVGSEVKYKEIDPVKDDLAKKIFDNLLSKLPIIKGILSGNFNSLELLIDDDGKFQALKLLNIESVSKEKPSQVLDEVFELKTQHDLVHWDKKTKLLISIPANIDRADAMMDVIAKIKKYTSDVYIGYGILSHPAILLREAGFKVERKISNYKVIKFNY